MSLIAAQDDLLDFVSNPLDCVEEIFTANDWVFDRMTEDEISVQVTGRMGEYILSFQWEEEFTAMRLCCRYDLDIPASSRAIAAEVLSDINKDIWLGHFAMDGKTNTPCFRHTALFRGQTGGSNIEVLEDLVDIALSECERFYPALTLLMKAQPAPADIMRLAVLPAAGQG